MSILDKLAEIPPEPTEITTEAEDKYAELYLYRIISGDCWHYTCDLKQYIDKGERIYMHKPYHGQHPNPDALVKAMKKAEEHGYNIRRENCYCGHGPFTGLVIQHERYKGKRPESTYE